MEIVISEGSYEHCMTLMKYLKRAILSSRSDDIARKKTHFKNEDEESKYPLMFHANNNTMKSEIKCAYRINFTKSGNIGPLLGFLSYTVYCSRDSGCEWI